MDPKIKELKEVLKITKNDYSEAKKALKLRYKEEKTAVKMQLKEAKNLLKYQSHLSKPDFQISGIINKCSSAIDKASLLVCVPFERKAEAIRYKQNNPEGYEADLVVEDIKSMVKYYNRRIKKGKILKDKDVDILEKLSLTATIIVSEKKGNRHEEAEELNKEIKTMLPEGSNKSEMLNNMLDQIDMLMKSFNPKQQGV